MNEVEESLKQFFKPKNIEERKEERSKEIGNINFNYALFYKSTSFLTVDFQYQMKMFIPRNERRK